MVDCTGSLVIGEGSRASEATSLAIQSPPSAALVSMIVVLFKEFL